MHVGALTKWLLCSSSRVLVTTSLYFVVVQVEIDEFRNYKNLLKLMQIFTDIHNLQHIELKTSSFERKLLHAPLVFDVQNVCFVSINVA